MGFARNGAVAALSVAMVLKGPANPFGPPVAVEVVDWIDRQLDNMQDGWGYNQDNPHVTGLFTPVQEEHPSGEGIPVQVISGAIPADLEGIFLRMGPNPWAPLTKRHMAFDGDGMLHTVRIKGGNATYHNAYMQTPRLQYEQARGAGFFPRIGELHKAVGIAKAILTFGFKGPLAGFHEQLEVGQANTAVGILPNGRLWALHEASRPFEFRVTERGGIESVGYESAGGKLEFSMSAHPKVDVKTEDFIFHGYSPIGGNDFKSFLTFGRMDGAGELKSLFRLNVTGASFSHDMALTESYAVVFDTPVRFDPKSIATGGSVFRFDERTPMRLAVIPRGAASEDEVRYFELPQKVMFVHSLHAWEEEDGQVLVLWLPLGRATDTEEGTVLEGCCDIWYMSEVRLDLRTGAVQMHCIDPEGKYHGEFSVVRPDVTGTGKARYGYTALSNKTSPSEFEFAGIVKWDMQEKRAASVIHLPVGFVMGEAVFVPKANASGDPSDDGYMATFEYKAETTDFVLYDARSFAQEPVVRLRMPRRVPMGFHGHWLSEEQLLKHLALNAASTL